MINGQIVYIQTHTQAHAHTDRRITFAPSTSGNKINKEEPLPTITCRRWPSRHVEKWDAHLSALGRVGEWQRCEHIRHFRPQTRLAQFHRSDFRSGPTWARRGSQVLVGYPLPVSAEGSAKIHRPSHHTREPTNAQQQSSLLRETCLVSYYGLITRRRPITLRAHILTAPAIALWTVSITV